LTTNLPEEKIKLAKKITKSNQLGFPTFYIVEFRWQFMLDSTTNLKDLAGILWHYSG